MEWIQAKYDRLLLGVFGALALALGGLLTMNALSFKKDNFPKRADAEVRSDFGSSEAAEKLAVAVKALSAPAEINEPALNGRPVELFVSTPLVKKAGSTEAIPILDPKAAELRPGIANVWLYSNDLPLVRKDVAELDTDGDGYTNAEEFAGKSNPRDASSTPPAYTKVKFVEKVTDPMTLILSLPLPPAEAIIKRTEPADLKWSVTAKIGDEIPAVKGDPAKRFKFTELKQTKTSTGESKDTAVLEDLANGNAKIELVQGVAHELPAFRAKLISSLVKPEEKTVAAGDEFTFEAAPEQHYKVITIEDGSVTLETWLGADGKKETIKLEISSAP